MTNQYNEIMELVPESFTSGKLQYCIMTMDDTEIVVNLRNAEHVRNNYIYQKPITVEEHTNYFRTKIETGQILQYIMKEANTGDAIGCAFLKDINLSDRIAEFGVFIGDKNALGKGYGVDAVSQMKWLAFDKLKLDKLILRVLSYNGVAYNIYKKAGFFEVSREFEENAEANNPREIILMEFISERG
ncbi:MAG: GNAT family protein [Lachnospiraceae bacterium]|nr:GNAT family protein [Lachnospiraceae bacterium]